jgi:hypothetical protein
VPFVRGDYLYLISGSPNYYDSTSTFNVKISYTLASTPLSGWSYPCLLHRADPVGSDRNGQPTAMLKINGQDKYILLGDYWTGGASNDQYESRYTHTRLRWTNTTNIEASTDASFDLADVGADNLTVASNDLLVDLINAWTCDESGSIVDSISANNLTAVGTGAVRGINFGGRGTFDLTLPSVNSHANLVIDGQESHSWVVAFKPPTSWAGFPSVFKKGDEYDLLHHTNGETWFGVSPDGESGSRVFAKWLDAIPEGSGAAWQIAFCVLDVENELLSIRIGEHDPSGESVLPARETTAYALGGYASGTAALTLGNGVSLNAIDGVFHWKGRALTEAEEETLFNGGAFAVLEDLAEEIETPGGEVASDLSFLSPFGNSWLCPVPSLPW